MSILPVLTQAKTAVRRRILKPAGMAGRPAGQIRDYIDEMDAFILWLLCSLQDIKQQKMKGFRDQVVTIEMKSKGNITWSTTPAKGNC